MALTMFGLSAVLACLMVPFVAANWDPATGHLTNYAPSPAWLGQNQPINVTTGIQASECAKNTRLHFPKVQLFAVFTVNHKDDCYHGCPYGNCAAYTVFPRSGDMVPSYTDQHSYFWHNTGGFPGDGVKPISDPQTGAYGYEQSITGKFQAGSINKASMQLLHDSNYPGFNAANIKGWTDEEIAKFEPYQKAQPVQPKCGRPCEANKDPGSAPGAYGGYKPADASKYFPPPGWKPSPTDTCIKGGNATPPGGDGAQKGGDGAQKGGDGAQKGGDGTSTSTGSGTSTGNGTSTGSGTSTGNGASTQKPRNNCKSFCKCLKNCKDGDCSSCESKKKSGCSKDNCNKSSAIEKC